jgi:hypothetical protein
MDKKILICEHYLSLKYRKLYYHFIHPSKISCNKPGFVANKIFN